MADTRGEFTRSLDAIGSKVTELFTMICADLPRAAQALHGTHDGIPQLLAEHEQVIDALYLEIEHLASQQVLLQAPVAHDLRFLLSVLRITPQLERSHDLVTEAATRAATMAPALHLDVTPRTIALAGQMADLATTMWLQTADTWHDRGRPTSTALTSQHQQMDQLHASITAELATGNMPQQATMEMTLIARCYQRLGAHAANITRRIAYLAGPPPQ